MWKEEGTHLLFQDVVVLECADDAQVQPDQRLDNSINLVLRHRRQAHHSFVDLGGQDPSPSFRRDRSEVIDVGRLRRRLGRLRTEQI